MERPEAPDVAHQWAAVSIDRMMFREDFRAAYRPAARYFATSTQQPGESEADTTSNTRE